MEASSTNAESFKRGAKVKTIATVRSLESLVGSHPDALREIYEYGTPADPTAFDGLVKGRLLAVERFDDVFLAVRPIVRFTSGILPWNGKRFESGGTSGCDVFFGRDTLRFRCELGDSRLDGKPTLLMLLEGLGNPRMFQRSVDELRKVGDGIFIGPGLTDGQRVDLWIGLEL